MTTDSERLAAAEVEIRELRGYCQRLETGLGEANNKLDRIVQTIDRGQGAVWLLLKIGGLAAGAVALASWVGNHFRL